MSPPTGFHYDPQFLTAQEARDLTAQVEALDYRHDSFRGQRLRRAYAQFGYAYVSTGRKLVAAAPMPDFLEPVLERLLRLCPPGTPRFNQCIITRYPPGSGIGWHTDAPCFGECIAAVSLGAGGELAFRPNGTEAATHRLNAAPGSAYVMCGSARWEHQHQVEPVDETRYSLTFRHVAG
jgi:alkylated DNA repair dioxygenase AlkB